MSLTISYQYVIISRFRIISLKGNDMQTAHGESEVGGTNNASRLRRQSQRNFCPRECRGWAIQPRANEDSNPNSLARNAAARMATSKSPAGCRRYKDTLVTSRCNSNRHKRGLEMPVTPCVINKNVVSNRHRFGACEIRYDGRTRRRKFAGQPVHFSVAPCLSGQSGAANCDQAKPLLGMMPLPSCTVTN